MDIQSYDIVTVQRQCDEESFEALVLGSCDTKEIYTLLVWAAKTHALGEGWIVRYAGKNSITSVEV